MKSAAQKSTESCGRCRGVGSGENCSRFPERARPDRAVGRGQVLPGSGGLGTRLVADDLCWRGCWNTGNPSEIRCESPMGKIGHHHRRAMFRQEVTVSGRHPPSDVVPFRLQCDRNRVSDTACRRVSATAIAMELSWLACQTREDQNTFCALWSRSVQGDRPQQRGRCGLSKIASCVTVTVPWE